MIFRFGCTLIIGTIALSAILRILLILIYLVQGNYVDALNNTIYVLLLVVFAVMVAFLRDWWRREFDADPHS